MEEDEKKKDIKRKPFKIIQPINLLIKPILFKIINTINQTTMLQSSVHQHNNILAQHHQIHQARMNDQFDIIEESAPPSYDEAALEKDFSRFKLNEKKRQEYFTKQKKDDRDLSIIHSNASSSKAKSIASNKSAWMKNSKDQSISPPIVIPQTSTRLMQKNLAPFSRAYPTQLHQYGIEKEEFVKIVDELNECFVLSPFFQFVRFAGMAVGCVPSPTLVGIGAGLQLAAGLGGAGTSYARTKAFVKKVNKTTFNQHGLQMRIFATKKMMEAIGEPEGERKLNLAPLPEYDQEWDPTSPETDPRLRRMNALQGRVAELDWNVPEPIMSSNLIRKFGEWNVQKQAKTVQKRHEKMCRRVNRYQGKCCQRKREKGQRKVEKMERREDKTTQRIRWICIVPISQAQSEDDIEREEVESDSGSCKKE